MPSKKRLRDLIVVIPGITGSRLEIDGEAVWDVGVGAGLRAVSTLGGSLRSLEVPGSGEHGHIVNATRLLKGPRVVPGLSKLDGYATLTRAVGARFEVLARSISDTHPGNYYEFPYDWRLDNRLAAARLAEFASSALSRWRTFSGARDARIIVIAHSMGGLVARYWLELLEGWRDCRALLSLGTPYRGSPNSLDYLANGYKKYFVDLTNVMRSFPSVHQLLPIYACLSVDGAWSRPGETVGVPGLDAKLANDGLRFHREIEAAVERHLGEPEYLKTAYRLLPFVGTRQPTLQAASLRGDQLLSTRELPAGVDSLLEGGDGTVPRLSAIPIELSDSYYDTYVAERHGGLQRNLYALEDTLSRIEQMQVVGLGDVREPGTIQGRAVAPALRVDIDDFYLPHEPVIVRAEVLESQPAEAPTVEIESARFDLAPRRWRMSREDDYWERRIEGLQPGTYRITVECVAANGERLTIHDLFIVGDEGMNIERP